ncbi:type III toxin-antitoxin system ToxN/AbiQ family toxin [Tindallia californiensis]
MVKKAQKLYNIVTSKKQPKLNKRCCDFELLENKCQTYKST